MYVWIGLHLSQIQIYSPKDRWERKNPIIRGFGKKKGQPRKRQNESTWSFSRNECVHISTSLRMKESHESSQTTTETTGKQLNLYELLELFSPQLSLLRQQTDENRNVSSWIDLWNFCLLGSSSQINPFNKQITKFLLKKT